MTTGNLLTTASTIQCTHGGQAILTTANTHVTAGGAPVLVQTDIHPVVGCPFTVGPKYSPCVRIEWSGGSPKVTIDGTPALVQLSIGRCIGAEGAPQGVAIVVQTQIKAVAG
jgi:hypothetical protein